MGRAPRIFITVGEVSGDQHAAALVRSIREICPEARIEGLGGERMREAGAVVHFETVKRAAMGVGSFGRSLEVMKLLRWTRSYFRVYRPDLQIGVDSSAMNMRFAALAKSMGVKVLCYVAPQIWAWREGRIKKIRRVVDRLACILPFEEKYFRDLGVAADYVGHPLFDELPGEGGGEVGGKERSFFRGGAPVVGLLAGSREGEARANIGPMLEVADVVAGEFPGARFLSPTTEATEGVVSEAGRGRGDFRSEVGAFDRMVLECDVCLVVSGTATLHVAAHGTPMIVVYRMNRVMRHIGIFFKTRTFALVNLLAEDRRHIVPEIIPWFGDTRGAAMELVGLMRSRERMEQQRVELAKVIGGVGNRGASGRVARIAMEMAGAVG